MHKVHVLFLIIILSIAAYLRLYRISEYMTFLGDEGRDVLVVKRMIVDHKFTLLGPTASVGGFFLGPVYYYFMIPFLWAWQLDPVGPAIMVALFGIATVYLVYRLTFGLFGMLAGYVAAIFYAVSPVVIAYSRSSWNPNIVPFFSLLLAMNLLYFYATGRRKYVFFAGIILGIGLQLHYLFLFLVIFSTLWIGIVSNHFRRFRQYFLSVLGGFLIGDSLYLLFEIRHGFVNTRSIIQFLLSGKETGFDLGHFIASTSDIMYRLFGRLVFALPERYVLDDIAPLYRLLWTNAGVFAAVGTVVFIVYTLWHYVKNVLFMREDSQERIGAVFISLWLAVVVMLFGFYRKDIYDYYLGILFPVPAILIGYYVSVLAKKPAGYVGAVLLTSVVVWVNWVYRPFVYEPNNQLRQVKTISRFVLDKTGGQPFNFALLAGQNTDHSYRYFFEIWGNPPVVIENIQNDPERKTVTDQLMVLCEIPDCKPLGHPLWEIAGFGRAEIAGQWYIPFVDVHRMVHYTDS